MEEAEQWGALAGDEKEEVSLEYNGLTQFRQLHKSGKIDDGTLIKVWDPAERCEAFYVFNKGKLYRTDEGVPLNLALDPSDVLSVDAAPNGWDLEGTLDESALEGLESSTSGPHRS